MPVNPANWPSPQPAAPAPPGTGGPMPAPQPPLHGRAALAAAYPQSDEYRAFTEHLGGGQPITPESVTALSQDDPRGFRAFTHTNPNWLSSAWTAANPTAAPGSMPSLAPLDRTAYPSRNLYHQLSRGLRQAGFNPNTGALRNPVRSGFSNPLATPGGREKTAKILGG